MLIGDRYRGLIFIIIFLVYGAAVAFALPLFLNLQGGLFYTPDTGSYLAWSQQLITQPAQLLFGTHFEFTYLGHLSVVALMRSILGLEYYGWGIVAWSYVVLVTGGALTSQELSYRLEGIGRFLPWVVLTYVLTSINLHFHGRAVLTDVAFSGLLLVVLGLVLRVSRTGPSRAILVALICFSVLTTFYRPTGLVLPLYLALVGVIFWFPGRLTGRRSFIVFGSLLGAGWISTLTLFSYVVLNSGEGLLQPHGVVSDPERFGGLDVVLPDPNSVGDLIKIIVYRMNYYFRIHVEYFSPVHNTFRYLYYVPVYLGVFVGGIWVVLNRASDASARAWWSMVLLIVGVSSFQTWLWSVADFNRYFVYAEATLTMLGLFGWGLLISDFFNKKPKDIIHGSVT